MSDFDDELRRGLAARAESVPVEGDWGDLVDRMTRRARRTTRALSLALVLVVCLSGIAVVVVARGDGGPATKTASKGKKVARDDVEVTSAAVPKVSIASGETFAKLSPAAPPNGATAFVVNGGSVAVLGAGSMDMARVFTRTTPTGVTIRAYRADVARDSVVDGPPWWTPPEWCFPNAYAQADVSNDAIAGIAFAPLYAAYEKSNVGGSLTVLGQNEKAVQWVVTAEGPRNAARLRVTFPNGSHDEMTPVDGIAVLVGAGLAGNGEATITALDGAGATIGTAKVANYGTGFLGRGEALTSGCMPQLTLPAPGAQQPADAAAARAAVADAFAKAYAKGIDDAGFRAAFDDAHGFADVQRQLFNGTFKEQVKAAVQKLDDVVFLSPTTAAIKYHIDVPGYSTFANRFNEVHLVNGTWKLSRAGWCKDVSLAGVHCPA